MKLFKCQCGNLLFFDNSICLQCGSQVGYEPEKREMRANDANGGLVCCANRVTLWRVPTGWGWPPAHK